MSTTTYTPHRHAGPATTINRHLKGEWTKLRTLPSTWRTAALAGATFTLGVGPSSTPTQQTLVTIVLSGYNYMATFTRRIWAPPAQSS